MGALILAPIQPLIAQATVAIAGNTTFAVNSGSLIVFASGTQTFTNPGIAFSTSVTNGIKTFYINNSGDFDVSRFTLTITLPNSSNVSSFKHCAVNVAFIGNNSCASGSSTTAAITPGSPVTYLALPKNGFYSFQISQNKTGTMVVSTSVNLAHITNYTTSS
jgi:hypothetical protein